MLQKQWKVSKQLRENFRVSVPQNRWTPPFPGGKTTRNKDAEACEFNGKNNIIETYTISHFVFYLYPTNKQFVCIDRKRLLHFEALHCTESKN